MQIHNYKQSIHVIGKFILSVGAILALFFFNSLFENNTTLSLIYFLLLSTMFIIGILIFPFTNILIHTHYRLIDDTQTSHLREIMDKCPLTQQISQLHYAMNGFIAPQTYAALVQFYERNQALLNLDIYANDKQPILTT
jgi:hypothetical protein